MQAPWRSAVGKERILNVLGMFLLLVSFAAAQTGSHELWYSTYYGYSVYPYSPVRFCVDSQGYFYVAGRTSSSNFPTTNACQSVYGGGDYDAFVSKFSPCGSSLVYSTYLGGSGDETVDGLWVSSGGQAIVVGATSSSNYPVYGAYQGTHGGGYDCFVTRLASDGTGLVYSTYLGGSGDEYPHAATLGSDGWVYLTGGTLSWDFPASNACQPDHAGGVYDAFVVKLSSSGSELHYSTYLGGSDADYGYGIASDSSGRAYVCGDTYSPDFPTPNGYQPGHGGTPSADSDAFVCRLSPSGTELQYSTYLGGDGNDGADGVIPDDSGGACAYGYTSSTDFPRTNACQNTHGGGYDVFITWVSPSGAELANSTYLGGEDNDFARDVTVDSTGGVYVCGYTSSTGFPTHSACQATYGGGQTDVFLCRYSSGCSGLVYSTYLGGEGRDSARGFCVDSAGYVYVSGYTASTGFPTRNPWQSVYGGGECDAFVCVYPSSGLEFVYSSYLGGSGRDQCNGVCIVPSGIAYWVGNTKSTDFPTVHPYQGQLGGGETDAVYIASSWEVDEPFYTGVSGLTSPDTIRLRSRGGSVFLTQKVYRANSLLPSPVVWTHESTLEPPQYPTVERSISVPATDPTGFFKLEQVGD